MGRRVRAWPARLPREGFLLTVETTLRDVLAMRTAALIGELARTHGKPAPNEEQLREMTQLVVRAMTAFVTGIRHPDAHPPSHEELAEVLTGVALGVIDRVITIVH